MTSLGVLMAIYMTTTTTTTTMTNKMMIFMMTITTMAEILTITPTMAGACGGWI
jgi:hypothetical protein